MGKICKRLPLKKLSLTNQEVFDFASYVTSIKCGKKFCERFVIGINQYAPRRCGASCPKYLKFSLKTRTPP